LIDQEAYEYGMGRNNKMQYKVVFKINCSENFQRKMHVENVKPK
jgi:hypothetical protein